MGLGTSELITYVIEFEASHTLPYRDIPATASEFDILMSDFIFAPLSIQFNQA